MSSNKENIETHRLQHVRLAASLECAPRKCVRSKRMPGSKSARKAVEVHVKRSPVPMSTLFCFVFCFESSNCDVHSPFLSSFYSSCSGRSPFVSALRQQLQQLYLYPCPMTVGEASELPCLKLLFVFSFGRCTSPYSIMSIQVSCKRSSRD